MAGTTVERTVTCQTSREVLTVATSDIGAHLMELLGLGLIESGSPFCEKQCAQGKCQLFQAKYGFSNLQEFLNKWQEFRSRASDGDYN